MIIGNKSLTIIFTCLFVFVLSANIALWSSSIVYNDPYQEPLITFFGWQHASNHYEYKGFQWFFERLSTFPGIQNTVNMSNKWANIVGNYSITGNWGIDFVLATFRILSAPLLLIVTIFIDIINSVKWFLSFFIPW